jgi:hypothetical protein
MKIRSTALRLMSSTPVSILRNRGANVFPSIGDTVGSLDESARLAALVNGMNGGINATNARAVSTQRYPSPACARAPREAPGSGLFQKSSRDPGSCLLSLLAQGWTDAMRKLRPDGPLWTFWDYKYERWPKDKGMRLDHFLLSPKVSDRLVDGGVDRWARGQVNASDHAPTWILLDL